MFARLYTIDFHWITTNISEADEWIENQRPKREKGRLFALQQIILLACSLSEMLWWFICKSTFLFFGWLLIVNVQTEVFQLLTPSLNLQRRSLWQLEISFILFWHWNGRYYKYHHNHQQIASTVVFCVFCFVPIE